VHFVHAHVEHPLLAVHENEIELVETKQRPRLRQDAIAELVDATCAVQRSGRTGQAGEPADPGVGRGQRAAEAVETQYEEHHEQDEQGERGRRRSVVKHGRKHTRRHEDEIDPRVDRPDDSADLTPVETEIERQQRDVRDLRGDRHRGERPQVVERRYIEGMTSARRQVGLARQQQHQPRHRGIVHRAKHRGRGRAVAVTSADQGPEERCHGTDRRGDRRTEHEQHTDLRNALHRAQPDARHRYAELPDEETSRNQCTDDPGRREHGTAVQAPKQPPGRPGRKQKRVESQPVITRRHAPGALARTRGSVTATAPRSADALLIAGFDQAGSGRRHVIDTGAEDNMAYAAVTVRHPGAAAICKLADTLPGLTGARAPATLARSMRRTT
jgi:hypothetical protein